MRKLMALIAAAALVAGCTDAEDGNSGSGGGGSSGTASSALTAAEASSAIPTSSSAAIVTAADAASASTTTGATTNATFNPGFQSSSEYATETYYLSWTANLGIGWVLSVVNGITSYQPTSCSGDTCTWGPLELYARADVVGSSWKLQVTKIADGSYTYALAGKNAVKGIDWLDVLTGASQEPTHGKRAGDFEVNLDNAHQLTGVSPRGVLDVKYSDVDRKTVDARFVGARHASSGRALDAAYHLESDGSGGDLAIALAYQGDVSGGASLHSRWDSTGAGRGDVQERAAGSTTSSTVTVTYQASECWDGEFRLTYDTDPEYGLSTDCPSAYGAAAYSTLAVP